MVNNILFNLSKRHLRSVSGRLVNYSRDSHIYLRELLEPAAPFSLVLTHFQSGPGFTACQPNFCAKFIATVIFNFIFCQKCGFLICSKGTQGCMSQPTSVTHLQTSQIEVSTNLLWLICYTASYLQIIVTLVLKTI